MIFYLYKPFSSHLTGYRIQNSSFISIYHRFSAIFLFLLLLFLLLLFLFSSNTQYFILLSSNYYVFNFIYLYIIKTALIISSLHILQGIKAVLINFNFIKI